jgi:hypothetical protein
MNCHGNVATRSANSGLDRLARYDNSNRARRVRRPVTVSSPWPRRPIAISDDRGVDFQFHLPERVRIKGNTMRMVKGILIYPFACTVTEVEHDASDYQNIYPHLSHESMKVGMFEIVRLDRGDAIYVDEEG